ncbi:glycoside hydrolase family 13 protein [Demequina sp. NBRC 110053]|uniref:glycoside hydrolase family 13 protein n=1 Tax=Demequina sp. NBRC 110053 TaxID=1570342 RepID=UPI0009FEBFE7|nr:glycoside hydrolase family 13 protein [Demequina sp. NBRC 110053]
MTHPTSSDQARPTEWWRTAVIYQIYPRSFADASGDGIGDLAGITARLDSLAALGVDAIWLSPFYTSPQKDAGYDVADFTDVDPLFGTLADFDRMLERAHDLGLRVIVDIVPNHTSDAHAWFQAARASAPGSPERARYIVRDGRGPEGELPPNNWESVFGGPAWTRLDTTDGSPGQWYLHLFDSSQPDLDWTNEEVRAEFDRILRFWLDRGVDGFRVDVAHGLAKHPDLPDFVISEDIDSMGAAQMGHPAWAQQGVHEIWRRWRSVVDEYDGDRILTAEAWVEPLSEMAAWVRPDEMHQAFNFPYLMTPWDADAVRTVIDDSLAAFASVGAPSTWVLSNHDVIRHPSRLALTVPSPQGHGIGPDSPGLPDPAVAQMRGRAATLLMLALPGSAYLFQGEELGLPEVLDIPADRREDPTFHRTGGERYGRDGCRVPLPWEADAPAFGFSPSGESWLPQPGWWGEYARDRQEGDRESSLELYRAALAARREHGLASASLSWETTDGDVLIARVGDVMVVCNLSTSPVDLPAGEVIAASERLDDSLPPNAAAWLLTT